MFPDTSASAAVAGYALAVTVSQLGASGVQLWSFLAVFLAVALCGQAKNHDGSSPGVTDVVWHLSFIFGSWAVTYAATCVLPSWLDNAQLWSLLSCYLFWNSPVFRGRTVTGSQSRVVHAAAQSATERGVAVPGAEVVDSSPGLDEAAQYATADRVDAFVEDTMRLVRETRPPTDPEELRAAGWKDVSTPTAGVFLKFNKETKHSYVLLKIRSQDQAASLPFIQVSNGRVEACATAIFLAFGFWPLFMPFCESSTLLRRLGPGHEIYLLKWKVLGFVIDEVLSVMYVDNLDKDGTTVTMMRTAPEGSEGRQWLGIQVPELTGRARVVIPAMALTTRPSTMDSGVFEFQADLIDEYQVEWIGKLFWQALATKIISPVCKMMSKFDGSAIDDYYNGSGRDEGVVEFYTKMYDRMVAYIAAKGQA